MKKYKDDFLPLWWESWFCSLTVVLGILNYFFGTNFSSKDNFDILWIGKWWRRDKWDLLGLSEIALLLDRLFLSVTFFSGMKLADAEIYEQWTKEDKIRIIKKYTNPELHHCIQGDQRVFESGNRLDMIDELLEERIDQSNITYKNELSDDEIITTIKKYQNLKKWWVLFVMWLSYSVLYNSKKNSNDGEWHIVICTWINKNNECIIYEPVRPRPNPHTIPIKRVLNAMHASWVYNFLMVKDNPKHR